MSDRKHVHLEGGPFDGTATDIDKDVVRLTLTSLHINKEALKGRSKDFPVHYQEAMYQSTERRKDDGTVYFEYLEQL